MEHGRATTLGMSSEPRQGRAIGWDWSLRGRGIRIEWSRRRGRSDHQTRKLATQAPETSQRGVRLGARMRLPKSDPWRQFPSVTYARGRAHSFQGWDIYQVWGKEQLTAQSFRRVLLGAQQRLRRRPRSRPDTEADSLDDLDLDDLDEKEFDDLFETYGEVVRGESAPTPNSSEADDDAESLALAVALAEIANEVKASEIRVLCVKPLVYWTRFFVIATGFSRPQVDAIAERMRNMAEERFKRTPRGDLKPNSWTLLDFGDVVVHIFYPQERSFYNLEEFYGNAVTVELPFKSQSQVR